MNIHIVWTQGWKKAPPLALRNAAAWSLVGEVHKWAVEDAVSSGLVSSTLLSKAGCPAMQADIILAAAMLKFGGMAVGADMCPMDVNALRFALAQSEKLNHGMVIYQSMRDEPYSGASYFPPSHQWMQLVCDQQAINVPLNGHSKNVSAVTGPRMWRLLMRKHAGVWFSTVRTVPAWLAFTHEPKSRGTYRPAWINPGLNGDWQGTHPERWT